MLSIRTIQPNTLELLKQLSALDLLADTRLVGGTALALQYGHRQSIDLDFFSHQMLAFDELLPKLASIGRLQILNKAAKILQVIIDDIKVNFVSYDAYEWIDEPITDDGVVLASPKDIAAMKVNAIMGRGSRKDFVDLYELLHHFTLSEIMEFYHHKYPEYSDYRALMSLTYFDDAECQAMPPMFKPDTWEQMKRSIVTAVNEYQK